MKVKFSGLAVGSCFVRGKSLRKKTAEDRAATVDGRGKVRARKQRGDPDVEPAACPLRYIGVGLRHHPGEVVEIGDGKPQRRRR